MSIVLNPIRREASVVLEEIRVKDEKRRREIMDKPGCSPCDRPAVDPTYFETYKQYQIKERAIEDPTTLILVDEADRLHMNSLEQIRSIFDEGTAGLVLIGMPGIEKRIARFPQFYSRIGFVHEFRPLDAEQIQNLLESKWAPDTTHEALRDLVRARVDASMHLMRARRQLLAFLLRHGRSYPTGKHWTQRHRSWLAGQTFQEHAHGIVFQDYLETVWTAQQRRDALIERISAMVGSWSLGPLVEALRRVGRDSLKIRHISA